MNFFGHAAVASWVRTSGPLALGAMLPDFASMARGRLRRVTSWEVAEGIELHHRTDAVFHAAPTFVTLCVRAVADLGEQGLSRGGARAAAHVATELLLDGAMAEDGAACETYLEALDAGRHEAHGRHVEWDDDAQRARFSAVRARLAGYGISAAIGEVDFVTDRVVGLLASRPRLTLDAPAAVVLRAYLREHRPRVLAAAATLLDEVRAGLRTAPETVASAPTRVPASE